MTKRQKKWLIRILIGVAGLLTGIFVPLEGYYRLFLYVPIYLVVGWDVLWRACRNIAHGQVFDENFLMCLATIGAFIIGDYPEAVTVMVFYQTGELFQNYAVERSRSSISALMDIRPDYANIERNGVLEKVDPEEVHIGETIVVKPGEKIPLDGVVIEGRSSIDTSALTGESMPRELDKGGDALSGCINLNSTLSIRVTKEFGESTVSKILDLVENSSAKKAKAENFITKFARYYTPFVVIAALLLAVVPPLFIAGAQWSEWIHRALIFLVISCPCALVISVPMGFFGGIGGASKCGVLVKGGNYLEALAKTEIVVFDKTGTLTKGTFAVSRIIAQEGENPDQLLEWAALAECDSSHPIAVSLKKAYGKDIMRDRVREIEEISGHGIKATVDGKTIYAGNEKLMRQIGLNFPKQTETGTIVYVAADKRYIGYILISDQIKEDTSAAIQKLKEEGVRKTVMLTGDSRQVGEQVGKEIGIDQVYAELLPDGKVEQVERLLQEKSKNGRLIFAGDGINDAPVLSRSDIGIAMGALGSDAAIEVADIVIMDDKPSKIVTAIRISKKTMRIVYGNIVFALAVKGLVLLLGAFGMANMWEAVFADVGVSVIAILNSMRALNTKKLLK